MRHRDGDEHQEPWLVSYADMMTLLFGFFVILYSFSQIDQEQLKTFGKEMTQTFGKKIKKIEEREVNVSESRRMRALQMLVAMLNLGEDLDQAVGKIEHAATSAKNQADVMKALNSKIQNESVEKSAGMSLLSGPKEDYIRIAVPDRYLFNSGSSQLAPEAGPKLRRLARQIADVGPAIVVDVEGHTDSRQNVARDNYALSAARAAAVADALSQGGVPANVLRSIGMGSSAPLYPEYEGNRPLPENMARNRRVEIVIKKPSANAKQPLP